MSMEMKQSLGLRQELKLTPQMQQAIRLLLLNRADLIEHISNEILENPTLEEVPGSVTESQGEAERVLEAQTVSTSNDLDEQSNGTKEGEVDWNKVIENQEADFRTKGASGMDELPPIETNLVSPPSLAEHLEWQLQMAACTDGERRAASFIVNNLDHRGWLGTTVEDIMDASGVDREDVEGALEIVQQLDPLGCGSRSLEECLLIQVRILFPEDPVFPVLLQNHLGDIEKRNYAAIARALQLELEDVVEYHKMMKQLEPWPGRNYSVSEPQYISPDIYVFKLGDEWQVSQNEDGLPKLRISNYYKQVLQGKESTREERDYIKGKLDSADFLIKSIYRRQNTIGRVMQCILKRQIDFFERGPDHLRPMVLRDVAEEVSLHESTVSRVTTNKYVQCPQGIFELKHFFDTGLRSSDHGEDVAADAVKRKLKRIVAAEDVASPLSDEQLVQLLKKDGVEIARRTVAKYREQLGILPSSKRKNIC